MLWDKYAGDALYAAMVYEILRLLWRPQWLAGWAMGAMTAIEMFQLTMIPARMVGSGDAITRLCGRLLGTQFSVADLAAYGIGLLCLSVWDSRRKGKS